MKKLWKGLLWYPHHVLRNGKNLPFESSVLTICTNRGGIRKLCTLPHSAVGCSIWSSQHQATTSMYSTNQLVFIMDMTSVICGVGTGFSYITLMNISRLLTAQPRVRGPGSPSEIWGGWSGTKTQFSLCRPTSIFPSVHFYHAPHSWSS